MLIGHYFKCGIVKNSNWLPLSCLLLGLQSALLLAPIPMLWNNWQGLGKRPERFRLKNSIGSAQSHWLYCELLFQSSWVGRKLSCWAHLAGDFGGGGLSWWKSAGDLFEHHKHQTCNWLAVWWVSLWWPTCHVLKHRVPMFTFLLIPSFIRCISWLSQLL